MTTHTSKELSAKLAEVGFVGESEMVYVDTRKSWKAYNCPPLDYPHIEDLVFVPFWQLDEGDSECEFVKNEAPFPNHGYNESAPLPAYDILNDLCVRYREAIWGNWNDGMLHGDGTVHERSFKHTRIVLVLLQQGKKQEAEDYILENSILFNT